MQCKSKTNNMEQKTVFKVGDIVWDCTRSGKGIIQRIIDNKCDPFPIEVKFGNGREECYTLDGRYNPVEQPTLSFTEYTLQGFSQERPEPEIEKDTLVYVSDDKKTWNMQYYSHKENEVYYTYRHQKKSNETSETYSWNYCQTKNPLEK